MGLFSKTLLKNRGPGFFPWALFLLILTLQGCGLTTTRPKLEMSLALSAFSAAESKNARIHAPNLFRRAEEYVKRAQYSYRRKYFNKAQQYAILARKYSEKAEYLAEKKQSLEQEQE